MKCPLDASSDFNGRAEKYRCLLRGVFFGVGRCVGCALVQQKRISVSSKFAAIGVGNSWLVVDAVEKPAHAVRLDWRTISFPRLTGEVIYDT